MGRVQAFDPEQSLSRMRIRPCSQAVRYLLCLNRLCLHWLPGLDFQSDDLALVRVRALVYKKEEEMNGGVVEAKYFQYPGPIPFSKETAILMMCDAVEAASKSVKEPTAQAFDNLVEKIVNKQMEDGQFMNADITFKELQTIKKVLKKKLKNIYHLRIEYPE